MTTAFGRGVRIAGTGRAVPAQVLTNKDLEKVVLKLGEPKPVSGRQEFLENLVNTYLHG